MITLSDAASLEKLGNTLAERIVFHAKMDTKFGPWTVAVYESLKEVASEQGWKIFPEERCYAGEYLCDFTLFDPDYGCRIACESQWNHTGGAGHVDVLGWAFDKLRGVKSDLKLFVFEGTDDEWLAVVAKYLDGYAQLSVGEAFLALRWNGKCFTKWRWTVGSPGMQKSPISFEKFGEAILTLDVNVLDVYGNNAAVRCPACLRIFVVSALVNRANGRKCPACLGSLARFGEGGDVTVEQLSSV